MHPETRYARSGEVHIAYQTLGDGPLDLVFAHGWVSHVEAQWEFPEIARFLRRLAATCRLIVFDKRGTGMSDRVSRMATMEQRMDDVRAVMDAAGSERAIVLGVSEAAALAMLFAATFPDRTAALIAYGGYARRIWSPEYPWAPTPAARQRFLDMVLRDWGGPMDLSTFAPSRAADADFVARFAAYLRQSASPGAAHALAQMNTNVDVRAALPLIVAPTLILHREHDPDPVLDEARFIASHIPGAQLAVLPGGDHWPFVGDTDSLFAALDSFIAGMQASPAPAARRARADLPPPSAGALQSLTRRQREVLDLMAQGRSNAEIARLLSRSEHTIHRHVANILAQLGVGSRAAAVALMLQQQQTL